jgi:RNA exonuclease 1
VDLKFIQAMAPDTNPNSSYTGASLSGTKTKLAESPQASREGDEQDWAVVENPRKKRRKTKHDSLDYPGIKIFDSSHQSVELRSFQDLVLYVLAHEVAPNWIAVSNKAQINKVIVLMAPGLDREMLIDPGLWNDISKTIGGDKLLSTRDALLEHSPQVRVSGERHTGRIHSPLQSMLIVPVTSKQKSKGGKEERGFQATRTPVSDFVLSADELRDAEYPIHPAAFTNPRDAELEHERRERTGQSISGAWVDTDVKENRPRPLLPPEPAKPHEFFTRGLRPYALDCEMVLTSDDVSSLARISLLDWAGKTIIDKYVKPALPIKNYFTEFSGVTEEILKNVTTTLEDVQNELLGVLGQDSILLGHSLESDLNALKLTHPFIVDTSIVYPHPRGLPLRSSLKFLARRYLQREIQKGGADGHDSVEDARAVLDLVKLKCEKGPTWGTLDANGESIFRRIGGTFKKRDGAKEAVLKTSAIVEYGTPERGLGKEATYHIACENDDDIVKGILQVAHGSSHDGVSDGASSEATSTSQETTPGQTSEDNKGERVKIPPGGVDFVWSRLRDLEAIRAWNVLPTETEADTTDSKPTSQANQARNEMALRTAKLQALRRIVQLYTSLPPRTLFMVYSGTDDMRPLLRWQNLHNQYKREFKVKKWDELSVKWTDREEQEMKKEFEKARRGVGLLAITQEEAPKN